MLSLKQKVRARLKVYALRVAISVSPYLRPRVRSPDKGIVARHRAVIIQAQSLTGERVEFLRQLALRRIARRDVKLAVGPETQATPGVQVRRGNVFDDYLAISEAAGPLAIARHTHALAVAALVGIRKIEQMIRSELRMQHDAHQTAFAARLDVRHSEQWRLAQLSVFENAHPALPLGENHATIRRPNDRPHDFQIADDGFNFEAGLRAG